MNRFKRSIIINCPVKKVFEFHSDTKNLLKITPSYIKVKIVNIDLPLGLNSLIKLSITQFGFIKTNWNIRLTEFIKFSRITDTQEKGPFKKWIHQHCFEESGVNTKMTDIIEYELPFGFAGKLADKLIVSDLIKRQFEFRHNATKKFLENS